MSRVIPFTEKVLLSSQFLDFICPYDSDKKKITETGNSIFQTLKNLPKSQFKHDAKPGSHFSYITRPAREVGRAMIIATVTLTASSLGVLCNGGLLAAHIIHHSISFNSSYDVKELKWNLINDYSGAFENDLVCFLTGMVAATILFKGYVCITAIQSLFSLNTALVYIYYRMARCFGGVDPSIYIARLLASSDTKVGLYNALEFRSKFGLVNQDGDLLKFSNKDNIVFYRCGGENIDVLTELRNKSGFKLIDLIVSTNRLLKENNQKEIGFKEPFDAKEIAEYLEESIPSNDKPKFLKVIHKFKNMEYKINSLKEILKGTSYIALNKSLGCIFESFKAEYINHSDPIYDEYEKYFYNTTATGSSSPRKSPI